jgi:hypothetical protein
MTDAVSNAARSAAVILAPELGPNLAADVEAALHARNAAQRLPDQYDPLVIAGLATGAATLIVSIAQLAWTIYNDQRTRTPDPPAETIARQVRITLREHDTTLPPATERITEIIATEITRQVSHPE